MDNIRAIQKAAEEGHLFGRFFISKPDFEFGNFSVAELETILWSIAEQRGAQPPQRLTLRSALIGATKGGEVIKRARSAIPDCLDHLKKGEDWGQQLMGYAMRNPTTEAGTERPIIEAVREALRCCFSYDYRHSKANGSVDPKTGRVERIPRP